MSSTKAVLSYFNIRGRGEPIRLAHADLGVELENDVLARDDWVARKKGATEDGTLCFGQLPGYRDEDVTMVQMNAILRHIGRKHGAYGASLAEQARTDVILDGVEDARQAYATLIYTHRLAEDKLAEYRAALSDCSAHRGGFIVFMERLLARNPAGTDFLAADKPTVADYSCLDFIDNLLRIAPDALAEAPLLKAWYARMMARSGIKAYIDSNPAWREFVNGNHLG